MQISISNSIGGRISGSGGGGAVEPATVYKLGLEGEIDGGVLFHYYDSTWYESLSGSAFYDIDLNAIPDQELATYTIDDVEALFSSDTVAGFNTWEMVREPNPDSYGFNGFPDHEYSSSQGIMDSFMSPEFLSQLEVWALLQLASGSSDVYGKIRVLYKEYTGVACIETPMPQNLDEIANLKFGSNWERVAITTAFPLGITMFSDKISLNTPDSVGNKKYFAARCLIHTGVPDVAEVTPVPPSQLNIYDTGSSLNEFPSDITPNVLLAYGDVLQPERLSTTIDRYRRDEQIQDDDFPVRGVASEFAVNNASASSINSNIVSTRTRNMEVVVKAYIVQQGTPPVPWYNTLPGETLYAEASFVCYKNAQNISENLNVLATLGYQDKITVESQSFTTDSFVLNGVNYYTALHTFAFDVSNVKIALSEAEKTALGTDETFGVVSDLAYLGSLDANVDLKMRSMLFEFRDLRFYTNLKSKTRNLANVLKTGKTVVVPTIGGAIEVGADASGYVLDTIAPSGEAEGAMFLSMRAGETAPQKALPGFSFEFDCSVSADWSSETNPITFYRPLLFDTRAGAITKDSVFRFVNAVDRTIRFTGTLQFTLDRSQASLANSPSASLEFYFIFNGSETIVGSAPSVTSVGDIDTYTFNIDYTHNFTGDAGYTVLDKCFFAVKASNTASGDIAQFIMLSGSTLSASLVTPLDANAPYSNPAYLSAPPAPIQRFTSFY
jgi:hypothetical protein